MGGQRLGEMEVGHLKLIVLATLCKKCLQSNPDDVLGRAAKAFEAIVKGI